MYDVRNWRHVFKLDPNKELASGDLEKVCESGTDAIIIGGTDGVTLDNVLDLMSKVRRFTVPCVLEVSNLESITPGFDIYFVPTVLNSRDVRWITGLHKEAIKEYGALIDWEEVCIEGYCILNADCKAAKMTDANTNLSAEEVAAYAMMAEKLFCMPIFYLEYSGTYGDPELVKAVKEELSKTMLFYGGGISTAEQAAEMGAHADVIVVGNAVYDNLKEALKTVRSVK
ncbi:putative glycerol-1-phosphate prenyltransferase [Bacillus thermophilus]|uniref:Heptaprenylglyceryl phosphate synthase n=1 Tax=Siminovitchia thermophila TaxID=1245522 RepID=A0ABS2RBG8_9BACI|nr:heptaprenylglyceryl phosphate synthase [Siminovitchia thermophila]MBM7717012.1 putative glycerol-1-phosphate prenyltransferase [Siminovitchia thermophila]ONK24603.1 geranylgeranylglyceryl/heptaprenylglyceryl phosphate synthase [Bacillus sp. VT-16-64]